MRTCRSCGTDLVAGENWTEGLVRSRTYLCRTCSSEKGKAHYQKHADRSAELQRIRLSAPDKKRAAAELKSQYYAANRDKWKVYSQTEKAKLESDPWARAGRMLIWIRSRSARTGKEFDLTHEWIAEKLQAGVCEVSGLPLELAKPEGLRFYPWAPSVDRLDSSKGYTRDNCRVVCWVYNMAKSDWDDATVFKLAEALMARKK